MKKVIIVHGWGGYPEKIWFPWLKNELENLGFSVLVPQLPDPGTPTIENWLSTLNTVITNPDKETFLVGHSLGCQTIIRYLEGLPGNIKIGWTVFVAGFFDHLTNMSATENKIAEPWLKTPINFDLVKSRLKTSTAIFSDDDPFVPLNEQDGFRNKLDSKIVVKSSAGHFSEETKTIELPIVLEEILKMSAK
jgi:predicted alpha/beta hydrolase family esterase